MCYLITFAVPSAVGVEPGRYGGLEVDPFVNAGSGHDYSDGLSVFSLTMKSCSCDLYSAGGSDESKREKRLRKKYERRGWSAEKISRALGDSARADRQRSGLSNDVRSFLLQLLDRAAEVQLIVHWHSAGFNDEAFATSDSQLEVREASAFDGILEDVRYRLVRRAS